VRCTNNGGANVVKATDANMYETESGLQNLKEQDKRYYHKCAKYEYI